MKSHFGENIIVEISGGSHEPYMDLHIIGMPSNIKISMKEIKGLLSERKPSDSCWSTKRREDDIPLYFDEETNTYIELPYIQTSSNMKFRIMNKDYRTQDYHLRYPRANHCDLPAHHKYIFNGKEKINLSGGGIFSGRMTAMLCLAGAISLEILKKRNIHIDGYIHSVGKINHEPIDTLYPVKKLLTKDMLNYIENMKKSGDSIGGSIYAYALNLPVGLGNPLFQGLDAKISQILMSIPSVKSVEFGICEKASTLKGSDFNDEIIAYNRNEHRISTSTNFSGGVWAGLSNSMPLIVKCTIKPTPSISIAQNTIDLETGMPISTSIKGRHDVCILPRVLPCIKSGLAIALLDELLSLDLYYNKVDIKLLRNRIDSIDYQIIKLLDKRMEISRRVGRIKKEKNDNILDESREFEILQRLPQDYTNIYREIFGISRKKQKDDIGGD